MRRRWPFSMPRWRRNLARSTAPGPSSRMGPSSRIPSVSPSSGNSGTTSRWRTATRTPSARCCGSSAPCRPRSQTRPFTTWLRANSPCSPMLRPSPRCRLGARGPGAWGALEMRPPTWPGSLVRSAKLPKAAPSRRTWRPWSARLPASWPPPRRRNSATTPWPPCPRATLKKSTSMRTTKTTKMLARDEGAVRRRRRRLPVSNGAGRRKTSDSSARPSPPLSSAKDSQSRPLPHKKMLQRPPPWAPSRGSGREKAERSPRRVAWV
mmetsp:Transcript_11925/g.34444  ORF Transcript_11925/g.34444 Transcript_11925/m.34444 type:complete len:265 (+) Transcript_11925:2066-2860(+)